MGSPTMEFDRTAAMISATIGVGLGIAIGWGLKGRNSKAITKNVLEDVTETVKVMGDSRDRKMVLVVRNDLKMGKGKIAAQCAHAAVGAVEKASRKDPSNLRQWRLTGQQKVVVKVEDEASLLDLAEKAIASGLVTCLISDAGRTQIAPGSKTVLGVGPGPCELVDQVTGHLKLL
ncbi:hypothetical protein C0Q70_06744 [Pomacea canaliculata]|uniref:peptidyl-tRNA hydrolase n=1 Tax=Pomacea canaliculata TaxID=400727 RepID=A0A2T7PD38_POMCA|nr:peptidyl-tRNA hydrolase 2, mitochondrial-like [Pomacea canaliculata]PVD31332.1 hypothetical protein C0Q70_06744 [Pomacea canaliculata]